MFPDHAVASAGTLARAAGLSFALFLTASLAHAHGHAHTHGRATLDVAIEPRSLSLQLSTPLDNLLGFERAPRTDAERRQADAAIATLRDAGGLFTIDAAAGCRLVSVELDSAALKLGSPDPEDAASGHADLDARFTFDCTDATKATFVDVGLFSFKRLQRLDVQVAAPAGQFKRTLKPSAARLSFTR